MKKRQTISGPNHARIIDEPFLHERHGEMGYCFQPKTELTMDDLMLYAQVNEAWGDRDLETRDNVVKLVEQVAKQKIPNAQRRKRMIRSVMAYIDELHDMDLYMVKVEGNA